LLFYRPQRSEKIQPAALSVSAASDKTFFILIAAVFSCSIMGFVFTIAIVFLPEKDICAIIELSGIDEKFRRIL